MMCKFIGIADLAANALIEVLEKRSLREVSFETLNKYGIKVIELLEKNNDKAVLLMSRFYTDEFIRNYSNYFYIRESNDGDCICLKDGVSSLALREQFRAYLSMDVLLALVNEESLSKLGV